MHAGSDDQVSSPQHKRARLDVSDGNVLDQPPFAGSGCLEHNFIQDTVDSETGGEDDEDDAITKPSDQKAGKRKVKIEYIQDKRKRHITFSKRKAEIMKKAYELSTLTGTQVLLLVVSETGDVYSFTTAKLEPLVTQPEGQNLIQACLNALQVDSIHRLPVEILSEIFLACAHTLDQSEIMERNRQGIPPHHHRLMFARNAVPYTVSSVCKRWRSIGLSTPNLWSKFSIPDLNSRYIDEHEKCDHAKFMVARVVALRTWLKLSKDHPLQFTCLSREEDVLMELFKNMHRWHIAYFEASYLAQEQQWFGNDGLKVENLNTLEFDYCRDDLGIAFERFPNLRRLRIGRLAVEEAGSLSLTHLTLTGWGLNRNTATFFAHLRQFPSLISFEVPIPLHHDLNHPPLTTFTYTTLTELTITGWYGHNTLLRDILANIHLPSIHRLCLKHKGDYRIHKTPSQGVKMADIVKMVDVVNDFIRRHESTFTDFELSGLQTSGDEMIETLRMFPKHLTSYQSELWDLTDECVKRLTLNPLDPTSDLAPNLSSISLLIRGGDPSGDLLAETILSRWARNPHTTFKLRMEGYYTGLNPLSDPRIARRMQYNPGLLVFTSWQY